MNQQEDVEVILGYQRQYKFHASALARHSTLFADLLTEANAVRLNNKARNAKMALRWMIELTRLPSDEEPGGRLDLVPLNSFGERVNHRSGLVVNENGRVPTANKAFAHYEAILYSFYGKELSIDDTDMGTALSDSYSMTQIADYLGCTSLISKPIEVALLKHGQGVFRAIQGAPHAWIEMAYRIRSELIYRECMIHLVGNWKVLQKREAVRDSVKEIVGLRASIEKYHRQLLAQSKQFEAKIAGYYPHLVQYPVEDMPIKRESYAKDILVWMALMFYRHWLTDRFLKDKGHTSDDCGYELFRQIRQGGDAYMDKGVVNTFHTAFPMTKKAMNVVENHLFELKNLIKDIMVKDFKHLDSVCQLDVNRYPVNYFTCTVFKQAEFPWIKVAQLPKIALGMKRTYKPGGNQIAHESLETARMHQRGRSGSVEDENEEGGLEEDSEENLIPRSKRVRVDYDE